MSSPYAVVVGGVNMDIKGTPKQPLVPRDSNPGAVTMSLGGVGRNIAHNMALLGVPTHLITALGEDLSANRIRSSCQELGIGLEHSLTVPGGATSTYLFITDQRGEMELAVSDMDIYRHLTPDFLEKQLDFLNGAKLVVCDTNIPAESLKYLADNCAAPLFVDPVSTAKAEKVRPILGKLHTFKPNALEAASLSGVDITDEVSLQLAAGKLLETGMKRVFISLGPDGVLAADKSQISHLPCLKGEMVNATGCGDSFMAAIAWGFFENLELETCAQAGLAAASITLAGAETINPDMSPAAVREKIGTAGVAVKVVPVEFQTI